ncbi:MAG: class I SAM-dependent DNA methyltransferase, partial [Chloroflexota bacterium]
MLTDSKLRSQVDQLWDKFWTGGLTNPLDAIEQFSYLLFLKRLDDSENQRQRMAERLGNPYQSTLPQEQRWGYWTNLQAESALRHLREVIFPVLRNMGGAGSSFERYMQNAELKINKPSLLIEACKLIDQMEIAGQQQDVQGDLYEYLLSKLNTAGRNGQFRTPRHIIRMMVQMMAPKPGERCGDLAAGTCGFLVNAYQYILETHTSPDILTYDDDGWAHHLIGDRLEKQELQAMKNPKALRGFDNDSGMTMLRIGSMNLMLHGIEAPQFFYMDTLSKAFQDERDYDVILMNPPFKGAVDKADLNETLQGAATTKSELLFLHLVLRALDMGGRCAIIVPDGVLFGSSRAHVEMRRKLVEENRLDGVISMPGGVFKPYAGVSTAVLLFTRGAKTEKIWFYDMASDGFSLDDKRLPGAENDIPDI